MTAPRVDARVRAGMARLGSLLEGRLVRGERLIGWKVGFGSPAGLAKLGLAEPLVGFLTDASELVTGSRVDLTGWTGPVAEPEIALYLGRGVGAAASTTEVRSAIAAIGPALELADVDLLTEDVETILGRNIFHRHVILGDAEPARAGGILEGLEAVVNGAAAKGDLEANTGRIVDVARTVATTLSLIGRTLEPGQVVIAGSIVPPVSLSFGQTVEFRLEPFSTLTVQTTAGGERSAG